MSKIVVKSTLDIEALINHPNIPCTAYINVEKGTVEILDDDEERIEGLLEFPTMEELCPYKKYINEYVAKMYIPVGVSASRYLKETGLMQEFYTYRQECAKRKVLRWLWEKDILLIVEQPLRPMESLEKRGKRREENEIIEAYYDKKQNYLATSNDVFIGNWLAHQFSEVSRYYAEKKTESGEDKYFHPLLEDALHSTIRDVIRSYHLDVLTENVNHYLALAKIEGLPFVFSKIDEDLDDSIYEVVKHTADELRNQGLLRLKDEELDIFKRIILLTRLVASNGYEKMGFTIEMLECIAKSKNSEDRRIVLNGQLLRVIALYNLEEQEELTFSFVKDCIDPYADTIEDR